MNPVVIDYLTRVPEILITVKQGVGSIASIAKSVRGRLCTRAVEVLRAEIKLAPRRANGNLLDHLAVADAFFGSSAVSASVSPVRLYKTLAVLFLHPNHLIVACGNQCYVRAAQAGLYLSVEYGPEGVA